MKNLKSLVVSLIITLALALTFVSAFASSEKITLTSTTWICYKVTDEGKISSISDTQHGLAEFTFSNGYVTIYIDGKSATYEITTVKKSNNTYTGTKIYCEDGLYMNVYISKESHNTEVLINKNNSIIIFDITDP